MANEIQKIAGGIGCDLVTGTGAFTPRNGRIYWATSNADGTRISSITEVRGNQSVAVTSRSYVGAVDINDNKNIVFDFPLSSITLSAGSLWVYYTNPE